jgi:periplasmic protein TonB
MIPLITAAASDQTGLSSGRLWLYRLLTVTIALAINGAMFLLLPTLLQREVPEPAFDELISAVTMIRLKKPEPPVVKEQERPPEPPPPRQQPKEPKPLKPALSAMKLPFEVNPRLPDRPEALSLPVDMSIVSFSGGRDIFSAADLDAPLLVTVRIPPMYPHRARNRQIEGWVRIAFTVHEDGSVGDIEVIESKPENVFETNVLRAVSGWRFRPGTIAGIPVKARAETTVSFKLEQ